MNKQALFLNLYCGMVAKPGSGKSQPIKLAKEILARMNDFKDGTHIYLGNDSVSKASLVVDLMSTKVEVGTIPGQPMLTLHEMTMLIDELATFMPAYEADKVGLLLKLFDCPDLYRETRVTAEPREVSNVFFNFLFGTQPDFWAKLLAFEQEVGLKSRTILCSEDIDIYERTLLDPNQQDLGEIDLISKGGMIGEGIKEKILALSRDLAVISTQTMGVLSFGPGYAERLNQWWKEGGHPIAPALSMGDYPVRRPMHVIKLSAHQAVSEGSRVIELKHLETAFRTLFDWEDSTKYMTLDLRQSEHGRVMDEAYQFFYSKTVSKDGKVAQFSGVDLRKFLSMRVRSVEIETMVTQMIQSGYLRPINLTTHAPGTDFQSVVKMQRFTVNPTFKTKQSF